MSLLSKANESVDLVKSALDAKIALATAEDKEKLADAKIALADLKHLIADLKDENQNLHTRFKERDEFHLLRGVYFKKEDAEQNQPYCPVCYSKGRSIPLKKLWDGRPKTNSLWQCPDKGCDAVYNPWDHNEAINFY